ncbi:MAG: type II CRISPR RNA-guided endonuclease Cas9 [Parcubacteria group bacterium CG11_big_fil_rev_8_21_14_0_20_39_22]|nr:MAG: type II CRISPR RNA-guided endonuclease Cas9 [Parcubacteria group bacterium CG11_big_fil_rev_8_21_14_0_20_39_22]
MRYTIGLDLGITSVGWAIIDEDKRRIIDLGVRYFDKPETPDSGKSLAEPRRLARSQRRRLARRHGRLDAVKEAFMRAGLSKDEIRKAHSQPNNPYGIRTCALDELISPQELFIAIYHIVKRRGYKSNRKEKSDAKVDKERGAVLFGIQNMKISLVKEGVRTVGELFHKKIVENEDNISFEGVRNKAGSYKNSVTRGMLEDELGQIFSVQQKLGNKFVTDELVKTIVDHDTEDNATGAFNRQKHYAQGGFEKMVGLCTFEGKTKELRAAKATYAFQYSSVLQKINHVVIKKGQYDRGRPLSEEERKIAKKYIFSVKTPHYDGLRKKLNLGASDRFNMVNYFIKVKPGEEINKEKLIKEAETKTKLPSMMNWMKLRDLLEETDPNFVQKADDDKTIYDRIGTVLSLYKTNKEVKDNLINGKYAVEKIPETVIEAITSSDLTYDSFGSLSLKALYNIIPYLEAGEDYDTAISKADYKEFANIKRHKLLSLKQDDYRITNPVVKRTISQTIKVVNAIIDRYGSPHQINIELARDLSKNFRERKNIEKLQGDNRLVNEKAKERMVELGIPEPKGQDILKFRLWSEQNCKCAYSGKAIYENRLNEDGYVEIDHVIPFSRSLDDSFNNKVLVLKQENQEKGNRIPYEWFGGNENKWAQFEALVKSFVNIAPRKRANLLVKKYVGDDLVARALNDTRYISKFVKNYIEKGLEFSDPDHKKPVNTVNGMATAYARKRWTLYKNREENLKHHAQDAALVAVMNSKTVKDIAKDSKKGEIIRYLQLHKKLDELPEINAEEAHKLEKEIKEEEYRTKLNDPWEGFRYELAARMEDDPMYELEAHKDEILWFKNREETDDELNIKPIFVSHMPRRKVSGKVHDDKVRSAKRFEQEYSSVKVPLTNLTEKRLVEEGLFLDPKLMQTLLSRLREFNGDAKRAFAEPLYKTMKNGEKGPLVRSVKLTGGQKSGLLINDGEGIVKRQSMVRVDIFTKANKKGKDEFYFIPVYAYHKTKKELPTKVCTRGKSEKDWDVLNDNYSFKFSVYPGDLLSMTKGQNITKGYYVKARVSVASLVVETHNRTEQKNTGIKSLDKLDKYMVDILGNYNKVHHEKRMPLS